MARPNPTVFALSASLPCHLFFKKYEPSDVPRLVGLLVVSPTLVAFLCQEESGNLLKSLLRTCSLYYCGLILSILSYRISPLHPLAKYPGPVACKISKLWLTHVSSGGKLHVYVKGLHDRYGPIVRVGPNELSINDSSLVTAILGPNGMPKGPLWDSRRISGKKSILIGARDYKNHAEARNISALK
ncbi:hypothetical protein MVEN_02611600 [Mycena venus]|uniref:Cytochrome P450 n=1 Tax=Mycena venus TaxID=2733690 RepID=A0A8H6WPX1_9AGAR|nr:hypothetical protein MVEN_02611600 [Mycena venus]